MVAPSPCKWRATSLSKRQEFTRKFNEILLAFRIEEELTKEEILSLYTNKIYKGNRAYGVAAAAQVYYGKTSINDACRNGDDRWSTQSTVKI